jgi:hypothetical protein
MVPPHVTIGDGENLKNLRKARNKARPAEIGVTTCSVSQLLEMPSSPVFPRREQ